MKPTLEQLKKAKDTYQEELSKLSRIITHQEVYPKVAALVGKYYKYHNSYGMRDKWWLYIHIKAKTKDLDLVSDTFHADTRGKIEFNFNKFDTHYTFESTSYIEITKREYLRAKKALMKGLQKHYEWENK